MAAEVRSGPLSVHRWGEIGGLRWGDVNFAIREIHIQQSLVEIAETKGAKKLGTKERRVFGPPKTDAGDRTIPLPQRAIETLRRHRASLGALPHPDRLVFTDAKGGPLCRSNFRRRHWVPLRDVLGLSKTFRFHDLRHCFASTLLNAGTDVVTLAALMGHEDSGVTHRVYLHLMPGAKEEAAGGLDSLFGT